MEEIKNEHKFFRITVCFIIYFTLISIVILIINANLIGKQYDYNVFFVNPSDFEGLLGYSLYKGILNTLISQWYMIILPFSIFALITKPDNVKEAHKEIILAMKSPFVGIKQ